MLRLAVTEPMALTLAGAPTRLSLALSHAGARGCGRTTDAVGPIGSTNVDRVADFLSGLVFIGATALLVLLAEPPGVIVAIIAVVVVRVLLATFSRSRGVNSRSMGPVWLTRTSVSPPAADPPRP